MRVLFFPFAFASHVFQVTPTTLLISECKDPLFHEITLTPTIPVRKNSLGNFLSVTFYLPKGLWLVSKKKCSVQLEGTKSVTVKVGATCTTLYGLKKLSVITPKIITNDPYESKFWGFFGLPTIWVCICEYFCEYFITTATRHRHPSPHHLYGGGVFFFVENSRNVSIYCNLSVDCRKYLRYLLRNPKTPTQTIFCCHLVLAANLAFFQSLEILLKET